MPGEAAPCEVAAHRLAVAAEGPDALDLATRSHVARCLRCQAEAARYRKLLRALRALRAEVVDPGPDLVAEVLAALDGVGGPAGLRSLVHGRRAAYLGGLAAATAAGAAGALVLVARSRRRVSLAG